jgi:N-acetylglucosamine-6-phosphate deacetylase
MSVSVSGGVARIANSELLAGSTLNMESAFRFLTKNFNVSIELASQIFSANPAALLGLHDVGSLKVGKLANILLLDDDHKIQDIFFQGEQIKLN